MKEIKRFIKLNRENPLLKLLTASIADAALIPEKSVCVSIGIEGISICCGYRFLSRIRITGFRNILSEDGRYPDPEDFASTVFSAANELKINKTCITLSIPKAWAIIQPVDFPLAIKDELSGAVSFELDRITPFSPENALYDFTTLSEKDGNVCLLLVAAKADLVNRYIEALRGKGMAVNRVTVNLSCISTLLTCMDKQSDFIFVQVGKFGYEGGLITNGSILSGFTGRFTVDETPGLETVAKEINTLVAAHSGHGKTLRIIADFINGTGIIPEHKLSAPVQNLRHMDTKLRPAGKNRQDVKEIPFTAAGGMLESLQSKETKPDLLCRGIHGKSKTPMALTFFLLIAIFTMGIFHTIMPYKMEKESLLEIDSRIITVKDEAGKVEELKRKKELLETEIEAIDNFKRNSPMFLRVLNELTVILPAKAWLTGIKISEKTVQIEGYADNATNILPKLETSPFFKQAEFSSATTRDPKKNADRFAVKMEIEGYEEGKKEDVKK